MRGLGLALLLLISALSAAQAPSRQGSYRPTGGPPASWRIDDHHSLVWNGARYTPVGVRVDGTADAVGEANADGVKDLLLDLPLTSDAWGAAVGAAEANKQRYLVRLSSLSLGAPGVAVDPAAYRIAGLVGSKHLDVPLPGASRALVVVALKRDGSIVSTASQPVTDGRLVLDTKLGSSLENTVLIYPIEDRLALPDFWEGLDGYRDALLARLRQTPFGPGLRGLVDPLGRAASLPGRDLHAVPTSPAFRAELADILKSKHNTVENAFGAWSLKASSLSTYVRSDKGEKAVLNTSFEDLARLVPLWSGTRGVAYLWDPDRDKVFACDSVKSRAWEDIGQAVAQAAARRTQRLCSAIRQVVNVPIVQEWRGWTGLTENPEPPFDGMAAQPTGEVRSELMDSAARAVSTVARWRTPGWLVATDVPGDGKSLGVSTNDLADVGLRAEFAGAPPKLVAPIAALRASNPPSDLAIDPLFFPENAFNPAAVQRLPGGRWWLPTPEDGNRLDLGSQFFGYRILTPTGNRVVMWARTPGRYLLRMIHPDGVSVTAMDDTIPDPKKTKNGLLVNIGQVPVVFEGSGELPVPEPALKETLDAFVRFSQVAESGRHVGTDESYAFSEAAAAFDANPGGSFTTMRRQLRRFAAQLSPVAWLEAETTRDTTFSEIAPIPGASNDQALSLRAVIPPPEGFVAQYRVPLATRGEVEMWVAARLSPERQHELEATIGGVTLTSTEHSVSAYGAGFAWYRLGAVRLTGNVTDVTLRMRSGVGAEAAIDAIVFAPAGWVPNGIAFPYDSVVLPAPPKAPTARP